MLIFGTVPVLMMSDPVSAQSVCEYIAESAWRVNRNINTDSVATERSAPFVRQYLTQTVEWFPDNPERSEDLLKKPCEPVSAFQTCEPRVSGFGHALDFNDEEQRNFHEGYARWTDSIGLLPYRGNFYTVQADAEFGVYRGGWATGAFVKSVLDGEGIVCAFDNRTYEVSDSTPIFWSSFAKDLAPGEAIKYCPLLLTNKKTVLQPSRVMPGETWEKLRPVISEKYTDLYLWKPFDETTSSHDSRTILVADVDGDGTTENLLYVNRSPGDGLCGYIYYEPLVDDLTELADVAVRRRVIALQGGVLNEVGEVRIPCRHTVRAHSYRGKFHFELAGNPRPNRSDRYGAFQPDARGPLTRKFFTMVNNQPGNVCKSRFSVRPIIVFDREQKDRRQ